MIFRILEDQYAQKSKDAKAADAKDGTTVAANDDAKGCDKPCCAHANAAANDKIAANEFLFKPPSGTQVIKP